MTKKSIFETERLFIRPTNLDDAPFIYKLLNSHKWKKYIGDRNIHSVKDAEAYIENRMIPQLEKLGYSNNTLIRKSDGQKIGTCGLYNRDGIEGVDIGFAFLPEFEKLGYAYESAYKMMDIGFNIIRVNQISAITTKENSASQKLIKKLGMTYRAIINIPNDNADLLLYSIDAPTFSKLKNKAN